MVDKSFSLYVTRMVHRYLTFNLLLIGSNFYFLRGSGINKFNLLYNVFYIKSERMVIIHAQITTLLRLHLLKLMKYLIRHKKFKTELDLKSTSNIL